MSATIQYMRLPWQKQHSTEPSSTKKLTAHDYEQLGRAIEQVYVMGYASKWRLFMMSLYRGVGYGLGIFIGGTIVVALLAYAISQFQTIPLLNQVIEPIRATIEEAQAVSPR